MICIRSLTVPLRRFSIDIPELNLSKGKIYLLLGESGCGKTTFLKCLSGFIKPHSGEISGIENLPALLMQNPFYQIIASDVAGELAFPLRNVDMPEDIIEKKIKDISQAFNLRHLLHRSLTDLSFGELQNVMLAATFISQRDVYLLDEPTSHLHRPDIEQMYAYIRKLTKKGSTVFIVSQYAEEYQFCDTLLLMSSGKITLNIPVSELKDNLKIFRDEGIEFSQSSLELM